MHTDVYLNHGSESALDITDCSDSDDPFYAVQFGRRNDRGSLTLFLSPTQLRDLCSQALNVLMVSDAAL